MPAALLGAGVRGAELGHIRRHAPERWILLGGARAMSRWADARKRGKKSRDRDNL